MSDRVYVFLYFAVLFVVGLAVRLWLIPWIDRHLSKRANLVIAGLFLLGFLWLLSFILFLLWSIWGDKVGTYGWKAALRYLIAAVWAGVMLFLHVNLVRMMFGPIVTVVQKPPEQPRGVGVAIVGVVVVLILLAYLFLLVQERDSSWAQLFLDLKVFVIWCGCGIYLLAISEAIKPLFRTAFGEWLTKHLQGTSDPKYSLFVAVPAAILASGVLIWHKARRN